jgi:hypothetical protein
MTDTPFFARFLEGQDYPELESDVRAGPGGGGTTPYADQMHTMKYPSDDDENPTS